MKSQKPWPDNDLLAGPGYCHAHHAHHRNQHFAGSRWAGAKVLLELSISLLELFGSVHGEVRGCPVTMLDWLS